MRILKNTVKALLCLGYKLLKICSLSGNIRKIQVNRRFHIFVCGRGKHTIYLSPLFFNTAEVRDEENISDVIALKLGKEASERRSWL